jgi:hypothetical protein
VTLNELRDEFAKSAMQAILTSPNAWPNTDPTSVAQRAYRYADAMLDERTNRRHGGGRPTTPPGLEQ